MQTMYRILALRLDRLNRLEKNLRFLLPFGNLQERINKQRQFLLTQMTNAHRAAQAR